MEKSRPVSYSTISMSVVMQPEQANPIGTVHGGEILKLMDTAAGVAGHKHARTPVVSA